jgi:hypothetical protein
MKLSTIARLAVPVVAGSFLMATSGAAEAVTRQTRYVATNGADSSGDVVNDCMDASHPCQTMQHAIDEADAGDTISVAAGSYAESVRIRISLTVVGAGSGKTTVTGDGTDASFFVDGTDTSTQPVVTIKSLAASHNTAADGIDASDATVALTNGAASHNNGSGLSALQSTLHINSSTLSDNTKAGAQLDSVTVVQSEIGVAPPAQTNTLTISHSTVNGNQDGGVVDEAGTVHVTTSTLDANVGAGVVADGNATTVTLARSTIAHTSAFSDGNEPFGGAVLVFPSGTATVTESTLYANTNFGMAVEGGVGVINNSTITRTAVGPTTELLRGGLYFTSSAPALRPRSGAPATASPKLSAVGTIDAGNGVPACAGTVADRGYNLASDGSCKLTAVGSHSHTPARLGNLKNNGGPTQTAVPGVGSAARNAIPFGSAGCVKNAVDQRDRPRRSPANGKCDIGSVEATVVNPTLHAALKADHHANGWYRGQVSVGYSCTVASAPLTHHCPDPTVFTRSGRNHHVTTTITAKDGGRATATVSGIDLDTAKPQVAITGVKDGAT